MKILFFRETELDELNPKVAETQGLAATENCIISLAEELSNHNTVKVIAPQKQKQFYNRVEYIPFQSYAEVIIHTLIFDPDILIVVGNPSILFERRFVCPTVFWQQNHPRELENRFDIHYLLSCGIKIVAPSPEAASYYNTYYKTNKITGIYNGVRKEFFNIKSNHITNKIVYIGSFTRAKGLDLVLKAARELPEYEFYFCGSFNLYGFVDHYYKSLCLELVMQNSHFLGSLPANKLAEELSTASLCIANPLFDNNETCCVSALESIVMGVPVITGWSEILEPIIKHGGIVTNNLVNSIRSIMTQKPIYDSSDFANELSWSSISACWERYFKNLI